MRDQLFHLPTNASATLQSQVRELIVRAILEGHIAPGGPLPSCRRLAKQLGIGRNTAVLAYQQLVDEGYLFAKERSGYFVSSDILAGRVREDETRKTGAVFGPNWSQRLKAQPSTQRNISKRKNWQHYQYPFIYGQFDLALFPVSDWRECTRQAQGVGAIRLWASDSVDGDDPALIEQLRTRVLPRRGVWATPDEILITIGAQHALYITAALLCDIDTTVGIEDPGYPDARNIFSSIAGKVIGLPVDEHGLTISAELPQCDCVYVTPSHHYPTTVTMSMARRTELLRAAIDKDLLIIEDDYESEFNFHGDPTPALKSLDESDRVLYVGSLSKTLAPGLRLGYLVGSKAFIKEARALRRLMLRHPPANNQRAVALFLKLGHHESLVRRLSHAFRERWELMVEALNEHFPNASRSPTFGGTSFWVKGPHELDSTVLAEKAAEADILIEPGDINFMSDQGPKNYFRLGFSSVPSERIKPGIALLASLIDR